jgi:ArsR family transcriptional regulator
METSTAIESLNALGQPTRLGAFRLVVRHEPDGIAAGEIARRLDVPANTLSTHLAILERAGLITSERQGRSILYRAEISAIRDLTRFLVNDCCGGRPELCEPLVADFSPCCPPKEAFDDRC